MKYTNCDMCTLGRSPWIGTGWTINDTVSQCMIQITGDRNIQNHTNRRSPVLNFESTYNETPQLSSPVKPLHI